MAASEICLDKLRSLCVMSESLGKLADSASNNADSDDVGTDPMLKAVRKQYLAVKSLGDDFLTIDRPPVTKKSGAALVAQYDIEADPETWPAGTPAGSISLGQWETACFNAGVTSALCNLAWTGV